MTKQSTTVKPVKIINESKLKLPQDIGGFSINFRREAARSVGRIMADEKKLECFLEMLKTFDQYARDRFEHQLLLRDQAVKAKADRLVEAQAEALRNADNVIKSKRAHIEHLQAEVDAHDVRMEKSK